MTYTGSSAATITLPDATNCTGRVYIIKNSSATVPTPVLTVNTTSAQTLDGNSTWLLDVSKDILTVISNGTNWDVMSGNSSSNKDDLAIGNLYLTTPLTTSFTAVNVPTKILGTTTSANLYRVTAGNNVLTYAGSKTKKFQVICSVTGTQASSNIIYSFYIARNGSIIPESRQTIKFSNSTDKVSVTVSCIATLAPTDYVEVWIENKTNKFYGYTAETLNLTIK
jgi:hypothetical protein